MERGKKRGRKGEGRKGGTVEEGEAREAVGGRRRQ